uniref:DDE_Tnp_IS1595 domain-containing protein n=1 Tax=Caenorhabditis tropicalis TaxID=1561998 RepID=A0A1I7TVE1_9PELO
MNVSPLPKLTYEFSHRQKRTIRTVLEVLTMQVIESNYQNNDLVIFIHRLVNHKVNFVDPSDRRVHTQSIESTWGAFKRELKDGFPDENIGECMTIYMFRRFLNWNSESGPEHSRCGRKWK